MNNNIQQGEKCPAFPNRSRHQNESDLCVLECLPTPPLTHIISSKDGHCWKPRDRDFEAPSVTPQNFKLQQQGESRQRAWGAGVRAEGSTVPRPLSTHSIFRRRLKLGSPLDRAWMLCSPRSFSDKLQGAWKSFEWSEKAGTVREKPP